MSKAHCRTCCRLAATAEAHTHTSEKIANDGRAHSVRISPTFTAISPGVEGTKSRRKPWSDKLRLVLNEWEEVTPWFVSDASSSRLPCRNIIGRVYLEGTIEGARRKKIILESK